jgi:FixJ family two-component response regulator
MTVMQAGAFAFFVKPFDNKRFLQAVQDAFCAAPTRTEAQT